MRKTFTLLELIVAVSILSVGIVFIYDGFFTSLGALRYSQDYMSAQMWMNQKLWDAQDAAMRYKSVYTQARQGEVTLNNKRYSWDIAYILKGGTDTYQVYEGILNMRWRESKRNITVTRAAYIDFKKE